MLQCGLLSYDSPEAMINLYELIEAAKGQLFGEPAAQLFDHITTDAELVGPNTLYVAKTGLSASSTYAVKRAIDSGAAGVLCAQPPECDTGGVSVVLVRDPVEALMAWSQYILGKFGTKVIGVTGDTGNASATEAIYRVLSSQYAVHANHDAPAGRLGIPATLVNLTANHQFVVLRMNPVDLGEMAAMAQASQPDAVVVTQISDYQSDRFDTPEQLADEMRILTEYLPPTGMAVLNYDDDRVRNLAGSTRADVSTIGLTTFGADVMCFNVMPDLVRTYFDLRLGNQRYMGQSVRLLNRYHLYGVLASLIIGLRYDIPLADSLEIIADMPPLPGHMRPFRGHAGELLIDDTHGAHPQATLGVLDWLEAVRSDDSRVFFVFGNMDDLGGNSTQGHRVVGTRAAEVADVFITRGTQAALAGRAALDNGMPADRVHMSYATLDAVSILTNEYDLGRDDIVLVKGGAPARMERIVETLLTSEEDKKQLIERNTYDPVSVVNTPSRPSWVEVDYDAIAHNVRQTVDLLEPETELMAVVKADAYGHGAVMTARTALLNGASYLGVSSVYEALELRAAGIAAPILVMNYTPPHVAREAVLEDLTLTLYDLQTARLYERVAREINRQLRVHVKLDTGMGRLGTMPEDAMPLFRHLLNMNYLKVEGIFTHFSAADSDPEYTQHQVQQFKDIVRPVQLTSGIRFDYVHASNSAGLLAHPEAHFDMVRPGIMLYGMHPANDMLLPEGFRPAMTWKAIVTQVKTLPPNHPVGYGNAYVTSDEERVALISVGYADGFRRGPATWGEVLIQGQRAPVIGHVSMEKSAVRIDHIPTVSVGDEVVLLGQQGDEVITAEDIAEQLGTINYEVTCTALPRTARVSAR